MEAQSRLTLKFVCAVVPGIGLGLLMHIVPWPGLVDFIANTLFGHLGEIFLRIMKMLIVPIVFVSLVCGVCNLRGGKRLSLLVLKTLSLYLLTTLIGIALAVFIAQSFSLGVGVNLPEMFHPAPKAMVSPMAVLVQLFPTNPIRALSDGNMLQIIMFASIFSLSMVSLGKQAVGVLTFFESCNQIIMRLIGMLMGIAPYGVFCILVHLVAKMNFEDIFHLLKYCLIVILVLVMQAVVVYSVMLKSAGKGSVFQFFKKIHPAMLFAFGTSSSSASIPVTLRIVEKRLKVRSRVASFVVPTGATLNMDGTAITQGVATVFLANACGMHLGLSGYAAVAGMTVLASIGTAGIPGVGLLTLAIVFRQIGIPVERIALIVGVDSLLDMFRTTLNVVGDALIAYLVDR